MEINGNKCNLKDCLIDGNPAGLLKDEMASKRIGLDWIAQSNEYSGVWLSGAHATSCSSGMSEVPRLFKDALLSYLDFPMESVTMRGTGVCAAAIITRHQNSSRLIPRAAAISGACTLIDTLPFNIGLR